MANFEIDASRFLLTYPQSENLEFENIKAYLERIGNLKYLLICEEKHLDGGKHHHVVVIYDRRIKRRNNVFNIDTYMCNVKFLRRQCDVKRAIAYVKKDDEYIEYMDPPEYCKKMDKKEKVLFAIGHTINECALSGNFSFSEICKIPTIKAYTKIEWPSYKKRTVMWFHGETGTGKTREAVRQMEELYGDNYYISCGKIDPFMIGYEGQNGVILDDFRPGYCRFEYLLRLLDGYRCLINIKGGQCEWLAETIIITAPIPPNDMFVNRETGQEWDHLDQLLRRIDLIKPFK